MKGKKEGSKMSSKLSRFKVRHPSLYEFILFNIMSNVATIVNFAALWLGIVWWFKAASDIPFQWFLFHYRVEDGGLAGFLSFVTAYALAQAVNFVVQRKVVFEAAGQIRKTLPWYVLTVIIAGVLSVWLPPYVIQVVQPYVGAAAPLVANVVNILVQVAVNFPMMKFVIMK